MFYHNLIWITIYFLIFSLAAIIWAFLYAYHKISYNTYHGGFQGVLWVAYYWLCSTLTQPDRGGSLFEPKANIFEIIGFFAVGYGLSWFLKRMLDDVRNANDELWNKMDQIEKNDGKWPYEKDKEYKRLKKWYEREKKWREQSKK